MFSSHVTSLFFVWLLNLNVLCGIFFPKSKIITPTNPGTAIRNGISIKIIDPIGTRISNNKWIMEELRDTRWSLRISLGSLWGFHSRLPSAIKMSISGQNDIYSNDNLDLLLSFDFYDQRKYFTMLLNLDNNDNNIISPGCDNNIYSPSQSMLNGDPYYDMLNSTSSKKCKAMTNDDNICIYEPLPLITNQWPLSFTIKNYPNAGNGYSIFEYQTNDGALQYCAFNQEILRTTELDVWITPEKVDQQISITQFNFESFFIPTVPVAKAPTNKFTNTPTVIPSNMQPTTNPTLIPTNPTIYPTKNPSKNPTKNPTYIPTFTPTLQPTTFSFAPSNSPTNIPSTNPARTPIRNPTVAPTLNPTRKPTSTNNPTNTPSVSPTQTPFFNPSITPNSPTIQASSNPTVNPTFYPSIMSISTTTIPTQNPATVFSTIKATLITSKETLYTKSPTLKTTSEPTRRIVAYYPTTGVDREIKEVFVNQNKKQKDDDSTFTMFAALFCWTILLCVGAIWITRYLWRYLCKKRDDNIQHRVHRIISNTEESFVVRLKKGNFTGMDQSINGNENTSSPSTGVENSDSDNVGETQLTELDHNDANTTTSHTSYGNKVNINTATTAQFSKLKRLLNTLDLETTQLMIELNKHHTDGMSSTETETETDVNWHK